MHNSEHVSIFRGLHHSCDNLFIFVQGKIKDFGLLSENEGPRPIQLQLRHKALCRSGEALELLDIFCSGAEPFEQIW